MKKELDNSHCQSSLLIEIIKGRLTEIIFPTRRRVEIDIYNNNTVRPNVLAEIPWEGRLNITVSFQGQDVLANTALHSLEHKQVGRGALHSISLSKSLD